MERVQLGNKLYYHGAEQYEKEKDWGLVSNFPDFYSLHVPTVIRHSGLVCRINPEAKDRFGNIIEKFFAVEVPSSLMQDELINKSFRIDSALSDAYEKRFYEQGIVPKGYFGWNRLCYIGCEKEYGLRKPD